MSPADPTFWTDWLARKALPLWSNAGCDEHGFIERLALDGTPQPDAPRRLMVQARQIHAFATAARRGWYSDGTDLACRAGETMIARYWQAGGLPGWAFSCTRSGTITDARRDFYAHAFVLLALASLIRIDPTPRLTALVQQTLVFLDTALAHPAGGYRESWPETCLLLRQNPHMHLLESLLALQETEACGDLAPRIAAILDLFDTRFLQNDNVLTEFYAADWTPNNPARAFEPGHHFEWIWLLHRAAKLTGTDIGNRGDRLLRKALHGISTDGHIVDQMGPDGPIAASRRLWPAMEAAKVLTGATRGKVLGRAWHTFFAPAHSGGWIDHIDHTGAPIATAIPASSLYHICTALDELD